MAVGLVFILGSGVKSLHKFTQATASLICLGATSEGNDIWRMETADFLKV